MKICPKCNGNNIWHHPENENWNEFYYCPKCQLDISNNEYAPYEVDEEDNLYDPNWNGKRIYFEFADTSDKKQIYIGELFQESEIFYICQDLEGTPTTTSAFTVHKNNIADLRDLLNALIEKAKDDQD